MAINPEHLETVIRAMEANPNSRVGAWIDELRHLIPKHAWQFYMNGTFCTKCGEQIGTTRPCQ